MKLAGWGLAAGLLLLPWAAAVEAGEQTSPYTETKLTAFDGARFDAFGGSLAISGDTAVIGATLDEDLGDQSGSYVFERDRLHPMVWTAIIRGEIALSRRRAYSRNGSLPEPGGASSRRPV